MLVYHYYWCYKYYYIIPGDIRSNRLTLYGTAKHDNTTAKVTMASKKLSI